MKMLARTKPMTPQAGNVRIQAAHILPAEFHLTDFRLLPAPTPMIAAVEQWLVETGMPVRLETNNVVTVVALAETPCHFSSLTCPWRPP